MTDQQSKSAIDQLLKKLNQCDTKALLAEANGQSLEKTQALNDIGSHLLGQTIGTWLVDDLVAYGGMALVYRVSKVSGGVKLNAAMKVVPQDALDPIHDLRFLQESQILATFDHPSITRILDLGNTDSGLMWTVMEWVEGDDLITYLNSHDLLIDQKVALIVEVCEALSYAHQRQIIHRDIKPQNIMVTSTGHIKLLDFGVAHDIETEQQLTQKGAIVGTPYYMSPEQAKGQHMIDARSDVFSMGVLLCQVLTGQLPFRADSITETCHQIIHDKPQYDWRAIKKPWRIIIDKCLAKEPSCRYQSIEALRQDILAARDGKPIVAQSPTWFERVISVLQRHPKSTVLTFILMASLMGMIFVNRQNLLYSQSLMRQTSELVAASKDIESQVIQAHMRPIHDINQSYFEIKKQLKPLKIRLKNKDLNSSATAHTALALAYLHLRQYNEANLYFQRARTLGDESENWFRGFAISQYYVWKKSKEEINRISDPIKKKEQLQIMQSNELQPLLIHLEEGREKGLLSPYVEGLLSYLEKDYSQALQHLNRATKTNPWFYEAWRMQSEIILKNLVVVYQQNGLDAAMGELKKSEEVLQKAFNIGRSDPYNLHSLCSHAGGEVQLLKLKNNRDLLLEAVNKGKKYCNLALQLDPTAHSPWINLNQLFLAQWSDTKGQSTEEVKAAYLAALERLQDGHEMHPDDPFFPTAKVKTHTKLAVFLNERNQNPELQFEKAESLVNQLLNDNPKNLNAWIEKALLESHMALYYYELDPISELSTYHMQQSIEANKKVLTFKDTNVSRLNMAIINGYLAESKYLNNQSDQAVELIINSLQQRQKLSESYAHVAEAKPLRLVEIYLDWLLKPKLDVGQKNRLLQSLEDFWRLSCQQWNENDFSALLDKIQNNSLKVNFLKSCEIDE